MPGRRRLEHAAIDQQEVAAIAVDGEAGPHDRLPAFDHELQPGDDAPGVMREVVPAVQLAVIRLLVAHLREADELPFVVVDTAGEDSAHRALRC
jgi:hypothetical protein